MSRIREEIRIHGRAKATLSMFILWKNLDTTRRSMWKTSVAGGLVFDRAKIAVRRPRYPVRGAHPAYFEDNRTRDRARARRPHVPGRPRCASPGVVPLPIPPERCAAAIHAVMEESMRTKRKECPQCGSGDVDEFACDIYHCQNCECSWYGWQQERIATLIEGLKRYGKHLPDCLGGISGRSCTCGLDALIGGKQVNKESLPDDRFYRGQG